MLSRNKEEDFSFLGSPTDNCQDEEQVRKVISIAEQMVGANYQKDRHDLK